MKKTYFNILLFLLAYSIKAYSQIPREPVTVLSPNTATLGVYGEIPVSLYTGTPNISIPLYDLVVKDYVLPISLNYHPSGVKVDQRPGWTGLGWTLFAGGAITRSVNDMPDDFHNSHYYQGANAGYYYNYAVLNSIFWDDRTYLRSVAQGNLMLKDTEPDEFSFNFAGYSGKFYLNHQRKWMVQCNQPIQVEFNGNFLEVPFDKQGTEAQNYGYSHCFNGFTIISENGTKYIFGGNIDAIDFSISFFDQSLDNWTATAWHLTKIILPTTEEINFTYERKEFNNQMYIAVRHDLGTWTESSGGIFNPQPGCSSFSLTPISKSYQGKLISPVYLKEITTDQAVISFVKSISNELNYNQNIYSEKYSDWNNTASQYPFLPLLRSNQDGYPNCLNNLKWYKLDSITVQNKNKTETLKTIAFAYGNSASQRLALGSITESGKNPYIFSYSNIENLPDYLANTSDHWGFYNGTYANLNYGSYYSYRNPSATYTKYGVLSKITYPTGGYTEFEFEPHYYRKQLQMERWKIPLTSYSSNQLAGGVRIKQIKTGTTSNGTPETIKEYFYVSDYLQNSVNAQQSSGVLGGQIQYYFTDYIVYAFNDNNVKRKMSIFSSISVLPSCQNTPGNHVGYTEVIEKMPDNSFSRYQFTNFDNGYMDSVAEAIIQYSRTPYEPYCSKAADRGLMILKEDYNANGQKQKSLAIEYEKNISGNDDYVRSMKASYANVCSGTAVSYDEGTSYKIPVYLLRPKKETETYYDPATAGAMQQQEKTYEYNSKKLISEESILRSDGKNQTTKWVYPVNIKTGPDTTVLRKMTEKNMIADYVEKVVYNGTVSLFTSSASVISGEYRKFNEVYPGIFKPQRIDILEFQNPVSYNNLYPIGVVESSYINGRIINVYGNRSTMVGNEYLKPRMYYEYDNQGNPRYITKDEADKSVYLWGYNHQYPIAEIKNATYSQVEQILTSQLINRVASADTPSASDLTAIKNLRTNANLSGAMVTVYEYKPLVGMTSATDPRGITTYYEYDSFGRLKRTYLIENGVEKTVQSYEYHYKNQ